MIYYTIRGNMNEGHSIKLCGQGDNTMSFLELPEEFLPDRVLDSPRVEANKKYILAELEGPGLLLVVK